MTLTARKFSLHYIHSICIILSTFLDKGNRDVNPQVVCHCLGIKEKEYICNVNSRNPYTVCWISTWNRKYNDKRLKWIIAAVEMHLSLRFPIKNFKSRAPDSALTYHKVDLYVKLCISKWTKCSHAHSFNSCTKCLMGAFFL